MSHANQKKTEVMDALEKELDASPGTIQEVPKSLVDKMPEILASHIKGLTERGFSREESFQLTLELQTILLAPDPYKILTVNAKPLKT